MKAKLDEFHRRYQQALLDHLNAGSKASLESARIIGSEAIAVGLETLDLVKIHEIIVAEAVIPGSTVSRRRTLIKEAAAFFATAITQIEKNHPSAREATENLEKIIEALSQRTAELAASNLDLNAEIAQRRAAEKALRDSERHYRTSLRKSDLLQQELRRLSRQILLAQENERKEISRELHDVIAQTLTGINLRLSTLSNDASRNTKGLDKSIAQTQAMVVKSVAIVHQFARELRPAVLDDLGLIPALHTFLKAFSDRTGVHAHLTAFAGVEKLPSNRRTALFRVAQEALTNVGRHAHAHRVDILIADKPEGILLRIKDDGRSFKVDQVLNSRSNKRLGILGMRERLEMVGGSLTIKSSSGNGTTIEALVPRPKTTAQRIRAVVPKTKGDELPAIENLLS